jgi:hypothetical protein
MSGGRKPREKGGRLERHLVKRLQAAGFACERIPLSGAAGGSFSGDLSIPLLGLDRVAECKARSNGFARLYGWLKKRDLLILRVDRQEPLVVLPLKLAIEIARAAENAPRPCPSPTMAPAGTMQAATESIATPRCGLSAR